MSERKTRHKLYVIKRDLSRVPVRFDEITDRLTTLCEIEPELDSQINPFEITRTVIERIKDEITTSEIDNFTAEICANNLSHPDYSRLASRLVVSSHHKNMICQNGILFSDAIDALYNNTDQQGQRSPLISDELYEITQKNKEKINSMICLNRDFLIDFFGYKTLLNAYLLKVKDKKDPFKQIIVECPQHMFMRVAITIHKDNFDRVFQTYDLLSQKYFTHATPTLFNAGTRHSQLFSCFILNMEDSMGGIFKCISDTAQISKWAGGIGISISDIRGKDSYIRGTAGKSDGIVPMLKVLNDTARYVNQGGKRLGSFAVYLEPWHVDMIEFLECKLPHGQEERRAKDLFYGLWIPDLFMKRVRENKEWSLMCPSKCPRLTETYGKEFEELYESYEREGRYTKKIKAIELWDRIINSQIETGVPYMCYKDAVNRKSNHQNLGVIKSSNLCTEINEYNDTKKYACCVLASIVLSSFVETNSIEKSEVSEFIDNFNYKKLYEVTRVITRNLDNIIDLNYYPTPETKLSNFSERPIGIGVQGLADVFFKMKIPYDSKEASEINKKIFETIYFASLTESCLMAKEKGTYASFKDSPISKGIFQFDMWSSENTEKYNSLKMSNEKVQDDSKKSKKNTEELIEPEPIKLSSMWSFEELKADIAKYGLRNSLLTALMPTASTAQIMGSTEAFEPITSNVYTRRVLAGEYIVFNKYLAEDLLKLGLWSDKMKNKLIKYKGSVQKIRDIPQNIKDIYKTCWEIKQKVLIDLSADRGPFVDQSQSLNLFFERADYNLLTKAHFYGHSRGLKTGSYYIRSKPAISAESFTVDLDDDDEEVAVVPGLDRTINISGTLTGPLLSSNNHVEEKLKKTRTEKVEECEMCSG